MRVGLHAITVALVCVQAEARASAAGPADQQLALAGAGAVKILVRGTGWVRVGQPALIAAGLSLDVDPASLQLFADGVEQAIAVTGNGDRRLTADEAIELYGVGRDTASTDIRTYWLVAGGDGQRVALQTGAAPGTAAPDSFIHTEALVARNIYLSAIRNGDASNFYGAAVSTTPVTVALTVRNPAPDAADSAVLSVALQGVTATAHAVDVALNGAVLGTCALDGQERATCAFPAAGLAGRPEHRHAEGARTATDYTATEGVWVSYPHLYAADDDTLAFTAPAGAHLEVTGFSAADVRIADVSDPAHPVALAVSVTGDAGGGAGTFRAAVDVPAGPSPRTLYAFTGAHVLAPVAVQADAPSRWSVSHDGELLILSHAAFLNALAPLVARRQAEGWTVQLADLQDVYDERGFGDKSPEAVRAFIQAARAGWRVPPRFVLLVGDATFDPRNFLGRGDFDFAPTRLIDTEAMETASDDWFVDADLDGVPEVGHRALAGAHRGAGRGPGRDDAGQGGRRRTWLRTWRAEPCSSAIRTSPGSTSRERPRRPQASVAGRMPVELFRRGDPGATSAALVGKLNAGPFVVNYVGHGSVEVWDGLFDSTQAAALTNAHPSVYVIMNCLNGFFHDLYTTSMAEALLEAPGGGAVAVWASSTLADFAPQPAFDQEFLMGIGRMSLGEAAVAAKRSITDLETRRTWLLFGDPTLFGSPSRSRRVTAAPAALDGGPTAPTPGRRTPAARGARAPRDATDTPTRARRARQRRARASTPARDATPRATPAATRPTPRPRAGAAAATARRAATPPPRRAAIGLGLWGSGRGAPHAPAARDARPAGCGAPSPGWRWRWRVVASARAQAAYGYRMDITLNRTRVGNSGAPTTLSNYPLLLDITSANLATVANGGHVQNTNGYDITFIGADTHHVQRAVHLHVQLRDRELHRHDRTRDRLGADPGAEHRLRVVQPDHRREVRRRDHLVADAERERHLGHELQGRVAHEPVQLAGQPTRPRPAPARRFRAHRPRPPRPGSSARESAPAARRARAISTTGRRRSTGRRPTRSRTRGGSTRPTRSAPCTRSGTTAPAIRSSTSPSATTARPATPATSRVLVRDDTGGTFAQVNGSTAVNNGGWHHFAVTRTRRHDPGVRRRRVDRLGDGRGGHQQHHHRRVRQLPEHRARGELGPDRTTAPPTSGSWPPRSTSFASRTRCVPPTGW